MRTAQSPYDSSSMAAASKDSLQSVFQNLVTCLEGMQFPYLVIGLKESESIQ